jgi:hypothetical protein
MARELRPEQRRAILVITKDRAWHAGCNMQRANRFILMTASLQHHARSAGSCYQQVQPRCVVMGPVVISVWNKKTDAGHQN